MMDTRKKVAVSLKVMAEAKDARVSKATYFRVDPRLLTVEEGFNERDPGPDLDAYIERIRKAMVAGAYIPPVDVAVDNGVVILRDGHCRRAAALLVIAGGVEDYTLEARQFRGDEIDSIVHMLGTGGGRPLNPLEAGRGYRRLTRYGLSVEQICEKLGVTRQTVDAGLVLADSNVAVKKMIASGQVSCAAALEAIRKHGNTVAEKRLSGIVASGQKRPVSASQITRRIPPKHAVAMFDAAQALKASIVGNDMASMPDDATVTVPAGALRALLAAADKAGVNHG